MTTQVTKEELLNVIAAWEADEEFCADLTDRSRRGHAIALREFREVSRRISEMDGVREPVNAEEAQLASLRAQHGDDAPAPVRDLMKDLKDRVGSATALLTPVPGSDKKADIERARARRAEIEADPDMQRALVHKGHPRSAEIRGEYLAAAAVLAEADAVANGG